MNVTVHVDVRMLYRNMNPRLDSYLEHVVFLVGVPPLGVGRATRPGGLPTLLILGRLLRYARLLPLGLRGEVVEGRVTHFLSRHVIFHSQESNRQPSGY